MDDQTGDQASKLQGKGKARQRRVEQPFSSARHKEAIYCLVVIVGITSGW
jgi:hypothetical protein